MVCCVNSLFMLTLLQDLDKLIERGKNEVIHPNADDGNDDEGGDGVYIYCVTCGHEVQARRAIRHLENCFNKVRYRVLSLFCRWQFKQNY